MDRRSFIAAAAGGLACASGGSWAVAAGSDLVDVVAERTFRFFWETTNPNTGLAPDRWPRPSPSSIAAVGFALTAYPIAVERGWISRQAASRRVLTTLRFLLSLPQGPGKDGVAGHHGFFYHFLHVDTGMRARRCELSTVDTTLLLGGVLYCGGWFDQDDPVEAEIRERAQALYARVDWAWAVRDRPLISMGWTPEHGWLKANWQGYNEGMLIYLLALGSPTHPVGDDAWAGWSATYGEHWATLWGQEHLTFPPLFGHQYSHVWVDFRGIQDAFMRSKGIDYFENSRRAVLAQRTYAQANPDGWPGYGADVWGLTACDGPGRLQQRFDGRLRRYRGYFARGVNQTGSRDDGTIAPTAAAASIAFAPEYVIPAMSALVARYGSAIWGRYGFLDAFNTSIREPLRFDYGRYVPGFGWCDTDYLGIDQGPILAMIANWRTDSVWRVMRRNEALVRGLKRAGFSGGWLEERSAGSGRSAAPQGI